MVPAWPPIKVAASRKCEFVRRRWDDVNERREERKEEGIREERKDEISRYNGVLARARRSDKLTLGCAKLPQKEIGRLSRQRIRTCTSALPHVQF